MKWLSFAALACFAISANAQNTLGTGEAQKSTTEPARASFAPSEDQLNRQQIDAIRDLERQKMILEIKDDLNQQAYQRLEIIVGGFGALLTILILFFAIKTERSASRSAEKAAREEMKPHLEAIAASATTAANAAQKAADAVAQIEEHKTKAKASLEEISALTDIVDLKRLQEKNVDTMRQAASYVDESSELILSQVEGDESGGDRALRTAIREAYESDNYDQAIELAYALRSQFPSVESDRYSFAVLSWAYDKLGNREEEIRNYVWFIEKYIDSLDADLRFSAAEQVPFFATTCKQAERPSAAIPFLEKVIDLYKNPETDAEERLLVRAYTRLASAYERAGQKEDERNIQINLIERFGDNSDNEIQQDISTAMVFLSFGYLVDGLEDKAFELFDRHIEKFSVSNDPAIISDVASVHMAKGLVFSETDRPIEAIEQFSKAIRIASKVSDGSSDWVAISAFLNQSSVYLQTGEYNATIAACDQGLDLIANATEAPWAGVQSKLLANKAEALLQSGAKEQALTLYMHVIAEYSTSDLVEERTQAARASYFVGKANLELGDKDQARAFFTKANKLASGDTESGRDIRKLARASLRALKAHEKSTA